MEIVRERKRDEDITEEKQIHGEDNVWTTPQRQKRARDLMSMLGWNKTMNRWYGHVLRKEGERITRRASDFVAECQRKKRRVKKT